MTSDREFDSESSQIENREPLHVHSRQLSPETQPDLREVRSTVLYDGQRSRKETSYWVIRNRHTGEYHHDQITVKTFRKTRGALEQLPEKSITLSGDGEDEIQKLVDFIRANRQGAIPSEDGDFLVINAPTDQASRDLLQRMLGDLSATGKVEVLLDVLESTTQNPELLSVLLERAAHDPELFVEAAAALNLATYRKALEKLNTLIVSGERVRESEFQALLTENPWMFGSEYSELLSRRNLTRDEQQDFVLRRTTDNYIEVIEIKTPLEGRPLFIYDSSHDCYYPSSELSKALGQVQHYLEQLDADRLSIIARDNEDPLKVRAKIIIGRSGDPGQEKSLRLFNGHLHRVEIITFDQLLRIANNVLRYLETAMRPDAETVNATAQSS